MKKVFLVVCLGVVLTVGASPDVDTVLARYEEAAMVNAAAAAAQVRDILAQMNPDGSFADILYSTASTAAVLHPQRLHTLAKALNHPGTEWYREATLKSRLFTALRYWADLDLVNTNWWYRYIEYPRQFSPSVVIAARYMTDQDSPLRTACVTYLLWAWHNGLAGYKTGANLADIAASALPGAVVRNDSLLAAAISQRIQQECAFSDKDGIHVDFSYSQHVSHGLQLYSGTYGAEFAKSTCAIAYQVRKTAFRFSLASVSRLEDWLADGVAWTGWSDIFDFNTIGRATGRVSSTWTGRGYLVPLGQMVGLQGSRAGELQALQERIDTKQVGGPQGNRIFWRHDFAVQRTATWYASVRATSSRTVGNESGSGDGIRNYHMADGVFMHMRSSEEYRAIFPLWDWHRIPGITAVLHGDTFELVDWGKGAGGTSDFAGGASDGSCGIMAMVHDRAGVFARKSWFLSPQCLVAVAASVSSEEPYAVHTTLEQTFLNGAVILPDGSQFSSGTRTLAGTARLLHNRSLYENLDPSTALVVSVATRSGSWSQIGSAGSTEQMSRQIFTAGIDHGIRPQGATYAYGIIPDAPEPYRTGGAPFPAQVLCNSDTLQVVGKNDLATVGAVFYKPGTFRHADELEFGVDHPCAVLLSRKTADSLCVNIADPRRIAGRITFRIRGRHAGVGAVHDARDDMTTLSLAMPTDMQAGSTVSAVLVSPTAVAAVPAGRGAGASAPTVRWHDGTAAVTLCALQGGDAVLQLFDAAGRCAGRYRHTLRPGMQERISFSQAPFALAGGVWLVRYHVAGQAGSRRLVINR